MGQAARSGRRRSTSRASSATLKIKLQLVPGPLTASSTFEAEGAGVEDDTVLSLLVSSVIEVVGFREEVKRL